jgi:HCOMODA/2-hydroxy-3-carboxy-muconic semialdehyde decarboxylase
MPVHPARLPHWQRRDFLSAVTALTLSATLGASQRARAEPQTAGPADPKLIEDLVAANHILAAESVVDGYGHVSVRHDKDPNRYLIARSVAPELVTAADILELDLDSVPVDLRGRKMYLERFIHGEIYKLRPDVKSVVHHHSAAVIPFGITGVPMRPVYHMAAFVGQGVPVFEIRDAAGDHTDLLIKTPELGKALAHTLGSKPAALMRGHGAVVVGDSLAMSVGRSIYLQMDARLQAQAIALGGEPKYLSPGEVDALKGLDSYDRAWELWKRKVSGAR